MDLHAWVMAQAPEPPFLFFEGRTYSYGWLQTELTRLGRDWNAEIRVGEAVCLAGDFDPRTIAVFIYLLDRKCIVALAREDDPLTARLKLTGIQRIFHISKSGAKLERHDSGGDEPCSFARLRAEGKSGLAIFTSGSAGKPKCLVHDADKIWQRFSRNGSRPRVLLFLNFDHLGGVNTLLLTLARAGMCAVAASRRPCDVLCTVEEAGVQLLPVTPSFLFLALASDEFALWKLDSLTTISYGAEPARPGLLKQLRECLPGVELKQTYGMSELGTLKTKSQSAESTWFAIDPRDFRYQIREGTLRVKGDWTLVECVGEKSRIDDEGWLNTGDFAEEKDGFIRVTGRAGQVINTGGLKASVSEIEEALAKAPGVLHARVWMEKNGILGEVAAAEVGMLPSRIGAHTVQELKMHCARELPRWMVPVRIRIVSRIELSENYKSVSPSCAP